MCPLGISGGMIRNTENPKAGKIDLDIFYLKVALARWCAVSGTPRQKAQIGISTVDAAAASRTSYSFMWLKRWENAWRHGDANKKMAAEEQKELMEMSSRHFCPASCQMWRCWSLDLSSSLDSSAGTVSARTIARSVAATTISPVSFMPGSSCATKPSFNVTLIVWTKGNCLG